MTNIVSDIGSGLAILKKTMRKVKERNEAMYFHGFGIVLSLMVSSLLIHVDSIALDL